MNGMSLLFPRLMYVYCSRMADQCVLVSGVLIEDPRTQIDSCFQGNGSPDQQWP